MSTLGTTALTYGDWAKRVDPDGKIAVIIEMLSQTNEILDDMLVREGNLPTGEKTTIRTGLPSATWRLLNAGVAATKSTTAQVTETVGMLETYSVVDKALANLNGDVAAFRLSEARAFLEGMSQQMAATVIYGNVATNPERFQGFAPRYNTISTSSSNTGYNVLDMGGTASSNTSLWLTSWGSMTCYGIFPKGSPAGLQHVDKGDIVPIFDGNVSTRYEGYTDWFSWHNGLCLKDWRYTVRACNIDTTTVAGGLLSTTPPNLINALVRMVNRLPKQPAGVGPVQTSDADPDLEIPRAAFYANRVVRTYLDLQALNKTNVLLQMTEWAGRPVTTFRGVPIRTVDAILNTETRIT